MTMKQFIALIAVLTLPLSLSLQAADSKDAKAPKEKAPKAKAYGLKTCLVTDEKLDADPAMKSYAFVHEGQEVKLCCKSCLKDFKKETAKYLKKLDKKEKEKSKS